MSARSSQVEVVVVPGSRRVIRYKKDQVGNDLTAVLRWCSTHAEAVWVYDDESVRCPHDLTVGWSPDEHVVTDGPWEVPDD